MGCFVNSDGNFANIYACFERKTAFVMQTFEIWEL